MKSKDVLLLCGVAAAMLFAHYDALAGMVELWRVSPMYSYGFTVPIISAYLLWALRDRFSPLTPRPSYVGGGIVLALGFIAALAGRAAGIQVLDQLAFLVSLTGSVLLLFGWQYLRAGWPAIAYLLLMIPVWDGFTEPLHQPFQMRSAEIGAWILQQIGVPAHRVGTVIALPNLTIEVARACSGVNYLVAVNALGWPLAYLQLRSNWRRVALLTSAVLIAALSNGLRVALIGWLAYLEVGSPLHGPFHMLHGLFVAGIGYVVLFVGLRWLSEPSLETPVRQAQPAGVPRLVLSSWPAVGLTGLFVIVGSTTFFPSPKAAGLGNELTAFPSSLGEWTWDRSAKPAGLGPAIWPGADAELRRSYRHPNGASFDLYVGYFSSQTQGRELVTYRATSLHSRASALALAGDRAAMLVVNDPLDGFGGGESLFWYDLSSGRETNPYVVKLRTLVNAVWRGRNDGAVVVITTDAGTASKNVLLDLAPVVERALRASAPSGAGS